MNPSSLHKHQNPAKKTHKRDRPINEKTQALHGSSFLMDERKKDEYIYIYILYFIFSFSYFMCFVGGYG